MFEQDYENKKVVITKLQKSFFLQTLNSNFRANRALLERL